MQYHPRLVHEHDAHAHIHTHSSLFILIIDILTLAEEYTNYLSKERGKLLWFICVANNGENTRNKWLYDYECLWAGNWNGKTFNMCAKIK